MSVLRRHRAAPRPARRARWALLAAALAVASAGCTSRDPGATKGGVRFPGLGVRVAVEALAPIVPVPAEGRVQLLYELRLTSFDARALRLESLEVLGAPPDGPTLARFGAAELEAMVLSSSSTAERRLELVPGALLVLCLWVDLAPGLEAPRGPRRFRPAAIVKQRLRAMPAD